MQSTISCDCGKELVVSHSMAGLTIDCGCGKTVAVPSLSELKRSTIPAPADKPQQSTQQKPPPKKLTRRKKLAYAAVAFLLFVAPGWLMLEIGFRCYNSIPIMGGIAASDGAQLPDTLWHRDVVARFRRSKNSILFYEPNPGATAGIYSINSSGFRDHEYSKEKEPGIFRIAMLGDSIVWGHGLELQYTFAKQLERLLNANSDKRFEVLNFGVSGYSTQQEVELYRVKASQYDPDLVIVGYCLNDFEESSIEGDAFKHSYYGLLSKSYLYDFLKRGMEGVSYNQFGYMSDAPKAQFDLRDQFRTLTSYCDGGRNVVVVFPVLYNFDNYLFEIEHRRIHDALDGLKYSTLDLLDVYRKHNAESLILNSDDRTHPNMVGTHIAAKATLDLLAETQLAPVGRESTDSR